MVVEHILAFYWAVVAGLLGWWRHRRLKARLEAGDRDVRSGLYRRVLVMQGLSIAAIAILVGSGIVSAARLGLRAPRSWPWTIALSIGAAAALWWTALRMRRKAALIREKLKGRAAAVVPETPSDLRWFAAISIGSGIAEELVYRGFMFDYVGLHLPQLGVVGIVLATSIIFGAGHLYQGWRGIVATSVAGFILGVAYLATGNLMLPMVVHAMGNARGALIFRPQKTAPTMS
jgi:membrane protease YdiL (CAAX protease family)